jgi:hypothetical protein
MQVKGYNEPGIIQLSYNDYGHLREDINNVALDMTNSSGIY